jgi:hypothetical protein
MSFRYIPHPLALRVGYKKGPLPILLTRGSNARNCFLKLTHLSLAGDPIRDVVTQSAAAGMH